MAFGTALCKVPPSGPGPRLTCRCRLHRGMPLTLPLATAIARADALEQVPPVVLLAPGIPNPIGCPCVLIIAPVCVRKEALKHVNQFELGKRLMPT